MLPAGPLALGDRDEGMSIVKLKEVNTQNLPAVLAEYVQMRFKLVTIGTFEYAATDIL